MTHDKLILLHSLLGDLEILIGREGKNWESDELQSIREVAEIVEKRVNDARV